MKAVLYRRPGGAEVLEYVEVHDPDPGPLDVVVRVAATALNHLDLVQRHGWYTLPGFTLPHIAGSDVAGDVVAVGSDVDGVAVGDRVVIDPSLTNVPDGSRLAGGGDLYGELAIIGGTRDGGYAELCLAPASHVYRIPDGMAYEKAATFPTCWLTAWHALYEIGGLQPGEVLLVHAAGSGVSVAAIQLAHWTGARVLATAGTDEKCEKALALGADAAVNNRTHDVAGWAREQTDGVGVDFVFDHVGPALFDASLHSLRPRGRLVNAGNTTGDQATIPSLGHLFHMGLKIMGSDPYRYEEFPRCWEVFCANDFHSAVDTVYPLHEAAAAQQQMLESRFFGKILLDPTAT
jgi:NADPH:quinone reductase-like Zn-dependent oxidoreductase